MLPRLVFNSWTQVIHPPVSASQVARISGRSHFVWFHNNIIYNTHHKGKFFLDRREKILAESVGKNVEQLEISLTAGSVK